MLAHRMRAALTALGFILASLLGTIHEARTRHVVCAAHGELIHADTPAHAARPATDTVANELPAGGSHGDEHCTLASATHQSRVAPRAPVLAVAAAAADPHAALAPRAVALPQASLYRTAPKTSPPA